IAELMLAALSGGALDGLTTLASPVFQPMAAGKLFKVIGQYSLPDVAKEAGKGLLELPAGLYGANSTKKSLGELMDLIDLVDEKCSAEVAQGYVDELKAIANSMMAAEVASWLITLAGVVLAVASGGTSVLTSGASATLAMSAFLKHSYQIAVVKQKLKNDPQCQMDEEEKEEKKGSKPESKSAPATIGPKYLIDPSGYVFEAVPENRLEGVM